MGSTSSVQQKSSGYINPKTMSELRIVERQLSDETVDEQEEGKARGRKLFATGHLNNDQDKVETGEQTEKERNTTMSEVVGTIQGQNRADDEELREDQTNQELDSTGANFTNRLRSTDTQVAISKRSDSVKRKLDTEKTFIRNVRESIETMKGRQWVAEDGTVSSGAINILGILQQSQTVIEAPTKIATIILETDVVNKICELIILIQEQTTSKDLSERLQTLHFTMATALGVLVNYTDTSERVAERVTSFPGFLRAVHLILTDFSQRRIHEVMAVTEEAVCVSCILNSALTVIYNVSMVEANIPQLRHLNFTVALKPYLKSKDKDDLLTALAGLAAIVDEEESEIINSNRKVVRYLMKVLRRALRRGDRRYAGWSCKELAVVIKTLARNDANKKLLVQLGALSLLVQMLGGSAEEITEAVGAIWMLSFDEENRKVMVETNKDLSVIAELAKLTDSDCKKIKTAANGALWNLREDLLLSKDKTYQALGETVISDWTVATEGTATGTGKTKREGSEGHIMISYQWRHQKTSIHIRDELIRHGFKIWMDVDNMAGSTLQAMADAVEHADLVLICFSQRYKDSPNCRAEAEYTFQRRKPIIPLRMELDYKPDGWLGILVGTKLFFDFSGKYEFSEKLNNLIREINNWKSQIRNKIMTIPDVSAKTEQSVPVANIMHGCQKQHAIYESRTTTVAETVRLWTADDVKNWISKNNLPEKECHDMTKDEVAVLLEMKKEAPEAFYKGLQKKFCYDLKLIAQFVKALKELEM